MHSSRRQRQNRGVTFPPRQNDGFVTVAELRANMSQLGLPHFQRGRVWDDTAVSMLMESLIDDTPCGSIILWQPHGEISMQGELPGDWGKSSAGHPSFLVVDGQQRLTAISALWNGDWAVNLAAFAELGTFPKHPIQSRNPFLLWPDKPPSSASARARNNHELRTRHLVRLSDVRNDVAPPARLRILLNEQRWSSLVDRIQRADQRRFHVLVKRGNSLPEIVSLYNRINSSGVPVRKEERAFAAMVSVDPGTSDWLRDCFKAAHPTTHSKDRNVVLKRQRERLFGFALFISAYSQTVGFHRDLKGDLDLLARDNPDLSWVSDEGHRDAMRNDSLSCIARTSQALRLELGCDDLRFLPSADPLRLTFALLLKYPRVRLATIAQVLLLSQINRVCRFSKPSRIERQVLDSNHLQEAVAAFPSALAMLGDAGGLERRLLKVDSMNDPWVSLMYWYQRSRSATDYLPATNGKYRKLDKKAAATKEHIVPFSWLYRHYDLDPRGHSARHVVNAIGNLTMISADMNYDHGADPVALASTEVSLLSAHHLDDPIVLRKYGAVIRAIESDADKTKIQGLYEAFRRSRTKHLAHGMHAWILRTTQPATASPDLAARSRRMNPSPNDELRAQRDVPPGLKTRLLSIGVKRDGAHWLLHRQSGMTTRDYKIRIRRDCTALNLGLGLAGADQAVQQLDEVLERHWADSREVEFALRPRSVKTLQAMDIITEFLGAGRVSGRLS